MIGNVNLLSRKKGLGQIPSFYKVMSIVLKAKMVIEE